MMNDNGKERDYFEHDAPYNEWLSWYRNTEHDRYQHPDVTIDAVMVTYDDDAPALDSLKTLLIMRYTHPYRGFQSLPGTFLHADEHDADAAMARLLAERLHANPDDCSMQQLKTYTGLGRDPRGQVVSISHLLYMRNGVSWLASLPDEEVRGMFWVPLHAVAGMELGFDHNDIVSDARARLMDQFGWTPNVFDALPKRFTLTQAMRLRSSLFHEDMDAVSRTNFRKKYQGMWSDAGRVDPDDKRSARLFSFDA